jgi:hypothetical protein
LIIVESAGLDSASWIMAMILIAQVLGSPA